MTSADPTTTITGELPEPLPAQFPAHEVPHACRALRHSMRRLPADTRVGVLAAVLEDARRDLEPVRAVLYGREVEQLLTAAASLLTLRPRHTLPSAESPGASPANPPTSS